MKPPGEEIAHRRDDHSDWRHAIAASASRTRSSANPAAQAVNPVLAKITPATITRPIVSAANRDSITCLPGEGCRERQVEASVVLVCRPPARERDRKDHEEARHDSETAVSDRAFISVPDPPVTRATRSAYIG
jgi:hypothetical protein